MDCSLSNFNRLKGQSALVTGANSGIGESIAKALAREGASVVVNYVAGDDKTDKIIKDIKECGGKVIAVKADVSKEDQVQEMFKKMFNEFGTIDILVNNAGLQRDSAFADMTMEQWQKVIDVNLTGQFLCSREAVKEFLKRGIVKERSLSCGKIICIS